MPAIVDARGLVKTFGEFRAVDNFWIGPNMRAGIQAPTMGAAASMSIEVVWVDLPLGEYVQF